MMYGESTTGLMTFPNLSSDVEQFQDFCHSHKFITNCLDNQLIQTSSSSSSFSSSTAVLSGYDLGDLFKAPEPLITTTITSPQQLQLITTDHIDLLNHVFYDLPTFSFPDSSCQIPKTISSDCLNSQLVNFNATDFGMRRAFSEGDIKTLSDPNNNNNNYHPTEDRNQKLSRYRNKRTKRNFARKIKYACRKALADTQPRIRGRFAKTS